MFAIDLPRARRLAFGVVLGQAGVTVIAGLCAWGLAGQRAGISALLGGGIATVASLTMAGLVFSGGAGSAARALGMFYIGEAVKLLLVVVWIAGAFTNAPPIMPSSGTEESVFVQPPPMTPPI